MALWPNKWNLYWINIFLYWTCKDNSVVILQPKYIAMRQSGNVFKHVIAFCAPATVIELLSGSLVCRLHQASLLIDWRQKHSYVWEPQWISSHHLLTKLRMSKCFLWVCCVFLLHYKIFIICSLQFAEHDSWFKQLSATLCSGGWLMYTHGHLVRCQKPATPAQLGCKNGSW